MPKIKVKGQTVQTGELGQTDKLTTERTVGQTDGRYQFYYLPVSRSINILMVLVSSVNVQQKTPNDFLPGHMVTLAFTPLRAHVLGISKSNGAFLLAICGIAR